MKKFDRLLIQLEGYDDVALNLADFGLTLEQIEVLVERINKTPAIKILILKHNSLNDSSCKFLIHLNNIESLDISYNDFTQQGIDTLKKELGNKYSSFLLCAKYNNTKLRCVNLT